MPNLPKSNQRVRPIQKVKDPSKLRISNTLKQAIHYMIHDGLIRSEAAKRAGMKDESLYVALRKPHVLKYKNEVMRAFRESEIERSFTKMVDLREKAKSEHVQADMAKTIASFDDRFQSGNKLTLGGNIGIQSVGYIIDLRDEKDFQPPIIDMGKAEELI